MKFLASLVASTAFAVAAPAADLGKLIFSDDFNRNESQEQTDDPGNGWGTNSKSRAKGDKQVDLKEGAMRIQLSPRADHAVSVTHPAEFTDGAVALRFMLEDGKDSLGLDFADLQCKEVHAGHLFVAKVSPKDVQLVDHKTGGMRNDIREARAEKRTLTAEQQQALAGKTKTAALRTETGKWHDLLVTIQGDDLTISVDGKLAASLHSPGIAHPTKRMLRLSVPRNAVVDDVKIWRKQ
ncbi:MAG TPA: hypothetical protein PLU30_23315 [Verrucomicrobiae bacterium]|nr:hypothetical protein [Verrucomicrobiae bacterium]